jgi:hypothetical protein
MNSGPPCTIELTSHGRVTPLEVGLRNGYPPERRDSVGMREERHSRRHAALDGRSEAVMSLATDDQARHE